VFKVVHFQVLDAKYLEESAAVRDISNTASV
jgi:hypothetical protein